MEVVLRFIEAGKDPGISRTTSASEYAEVISDTMHVKVLPEDVVSAAKRLCLRHEQRGEETVFPFELRPSDLGQLRVPERLRHWPVGKRVFFQREPETCHGYPKYEFAVLLRANRPVQVGYFTLAHLDDFSPSYFEIFERFRRRGFGSEVVGLLERIMRGRTMKIYSLAEAIPFWWQLGFCRDGPTGALLKTMPVCGTFLSKKCFVERC